jgi:peptidase E
MVACTTFRGNNMQFIQFIPTANVLETMYGIRRKYFQRARNAL